MSTFELRPRQDDAGPHGGHEGLADPVLRRNARWFTHVRWLVAGVLALAGVAGRSRSLIDRLGAEPPWMTFRILSATLAAANVVFLLKAGHFGAETPRHTAKTWLWLQIGLDLAVVTVLVHVVGGTDTYIPFTYLFHIALACIFFPPRESLLVTLLAVVLYASVVTLELAQVLPDAGILRGLRAVQGPGERGAFAASAVFVWLVVWYLVSSLSQVVRSQDGQLREANARLRKAAEEKNQQMLITTHDLKAPFAGIESNIQVLKFRFWDEIPESVQAIVDRIHFRAQALSRRINDILVLGDLRSRAAEDKDREVVPLGGLMEDVMAELQEHARSRQVSVRVDVGSLAVTGNREQYGILLANLTSNAIAYSHEGGAVEVTATEGTEGVRVAVADSGIGIRPEALPHIFDEYYHTQEAVRFNRLSTGLGLAIVKVVAERFGLTVRVTSEVDRGTTFQILLPKAVARQATGGLGTWPES